MYSLSLGTCLDKMTLITSLQKITERKLLHTIFIIFKFVFKLCIYIPAYTESHTLCQSDKTAFFCYFDI